MSTEKNNDSDKIDFILNKIKTMKETGKLPLDKARDLRETIASMESSGMTDIMITALLKMDITAGLKYTESELALIEEKIDEMFPVGHKPMATTLVPFGYYLGKMFITKFPGSEWYVSDKANETNDIWDVSVKLKVDDSKHTMEVKPFRRVQKFWKNREDKMTSMLRMVIFTTEISMDAEYWTKRADEDGWILMGSGDMLRMFVGEKGGDMSDQDTKDLKGAFHKGTYGDGK